MDIFEESRQLNNLSKSNLIIRNVMSHCDKDNIGEREMLVMLVTALAESNKTLEDLLIKSEHENPVPIMFRPTRAKPRDIMKEFYELYERQSRLALEVGHNHVADWCVSIYDTKGKTLTEFVKPDISIQECSYELAIAKAYVELCEYLYEHRGGY